MKLDDIDPALAQFKAFSRHSHGTVSHVQAMRETAIFTNGQLPAKTKAMMAALWGVATHCEPCLRFYVQKAKEAGASEAELGEVLAIASAMGGCVGEMWALKAFAAYQSDESEADVGCCE